MSEPQQAQTVGLIVLFVCGGSGLAVQAFTKPVYGIALVLFYYDQRIRKEGFDVEWMMQRAGLVAPAPAEQFAETLQPWMAADGSTAVAVPANAVAPEDQGVGANEEKP